jgi:branched-chain amino acid transport system substrate-binding protein
MSCDSSRGMGINNEDFGLIAGPASVETLMTLYPSPSGPDAVEFAARFPEDIHPPFPVYAAIQVWAQAVKKTGTFETGAVAEALRSHEFDTVLGRIGFDENGDVTSHDTFVWYVWKNGKYAPVAPSKLTE